MTPISAYFLGIVTVILIFLMYWFIATTNRTINTVYRNSICYGVCSYTGVLPVGTKSMSNIQDSRI